MLLQQSKGKQVANFGPLYWLFKEELENYLELDNDHELTIVSSGHTALMAAYYLANTSSALVPSYTFASTMQAAQLQGMLTVIADVDPKTGTFNEAVLSKWKNHFDTLVVVCPLSVVPDLSFFDSWCRTNGKKLIIDGAATFGTSGSHFNLGDAYCMSFHATKTLPVGECGCIIHKKEKSERVKRYINFGLSPEKKIMSPGINAKVSDYTCAIGLSLLHKIGPHIQARKDNAKRYKTEITRATFLTSKEDTAYSSFPVFLPGPVEASNKVNYLKTLGIESLQYYNPLDESFHANRLHDTNICLPCHSGVTPEAMDKIIEVING